MAANDDDYDKYHNNQNLAPHPHPAIPTLPSLPALSALILSNDA